MFILLDTITAACATSYWNIMQRKYILVWNKNKWWKIQALDAEKKSVINTTIFFQTNHTAFYCWHKVTVWKLCFNLMTNHYCCAVLFFLKNNYSNQPSKFTCIRWADDLIIPSCPDDAALNRGYTLWTRLKLDIIHVVTK